ncbi:hypothetical protein ACOTTU_19875 [Roseobacter sp. EG26]|uniref:hypothetical protein n=1 Tax=Roseobacter sp. EG26 TaxID=3412477 RepID=UPI003CE4A5C5
MSQQPSKRRILRHPIAALALGAFLATHPALADACKIPGYLEQYAQAAAAPEGAICTTYLDQQGGTGVSCHWAFPFRDDAATRFSNTVWTEIQTCRDGKALSPDQQVNHPDSYDLREWSSDRKTFRVSVKDKGGENRTLVFVSYEPRGE